MGNIVGKFIETNNDAIFSTNQYYIYYKLITISQWRDGCLNF